MTKQEQLDSFIQTEQAVKARLHDKWDDFCTKFRETLESKGDDYAGSEDRLSNFKVAGELTGITPEVQCLSLIATKVARLSQLLSSDKAPNNEPLKDSELDLIVYGFLLVMLGEDKK